MSPRIGFASDPKSTRELTPDEEKRRERAKQTALNYYGIPPEPEQVEAPLTPEPDAADLIEAGYEKAIQNSDTAMEFSRRSLAQAEKELELLQSQNRILGEVDAIVDNLEQRRQHMEQPQDRVHRAISSALADAGLDFTDPSYQEWARNMQGDEAQILGSFASWMRKRGERDVSKAQKQTRSVGAASAVGGGPAVPATASGDVDDWTQELDRLQRSGNLTSPANRKRRAELRELLSQNTPQRRDIR